ncbi:MAG: AMP-binding protein [Limisphaerales bacterium]
MTEHREKIFSKQESLSSAEYDAGQASRLPIAGGADVNDTEKDYPKCDCLSELFEAQAARTPTAIAVFSPTKNELGENQLTYRELNRRANQLAWHLKKLGVGPDLVVGICAERSLETSIAVLAIIKAGGAYLPLDPSYPKGRLILMLEETQAPVILTQQKLVAGLPHHGTKLFCLDTDWKKIAEENDKNPTLEVTPENLVYLIYTSGSTGRPKGVAMEQGPLINLLYWQMENCSFTPAARTLQFASLNFDVSFQEIFSTWCSGGTLILIGDKERRDSSLLVQFLHDHEVERLFLPFVALKHLADAAEQQEIFPQCLKEIITAGEQLQITPPMMRFFNRLSGCTLENQYGPS